MLAEAARLYEQMGVSGADEARARHGGSGVTLRGAGIRRLLAAHHACCLRAHRLFSRQPFNYPGHPMANEAALLCDYNGSEGRTTGPTARARRRDDDRCQPPPRWYHLRRIEVRDDSC